MISRSSLSGRAIENSESNIFLPPKNISKDLSLVRSLSHEVLSLREGTGFGPPLGKMSAASRIARRILLGTKNPIFLLVMLTHRTPQNAMTHGKVRVVLAPPIAPSE